ncbi:unnamed protein product [Cylicocyclus nassatus]|uniref:Uncharacterized protein n=1 Tax=Cylicocyclus nassatus TaxID=53992 RepID=A0AA36H0L7_CYLNA|nr:unnamed protein product [Cylicocyclus nassatus]
MRKMAYDCALERKAANALDGICSETPEMPQNENGYFISYAAAIRSPLCAIVITRLNFQYYRQKLEGRLLRCSTKISNPILYSSLLKEL